MMKTVVIIPSRFGSTRFPGKPLARLNGKPMIEHVYLRAFSASSVTDVVVATDDGRIRDAVKAFGGKALMTAPENRSGTDRVAEAAAAMNLAPTDLVINLQGDQPLFEPLSLDEVVAPFAVDATLEMSTLAFKIVNPREITDPKDVKVVLDADGFALYFSRATIPFARDPDTCFDTYKHLGVYAYTRAFLDGFRCLPEGHLEAIEKLEQLRALEYGHRIKVVITAHDSPEVDLPIDIERIESLMAS
jgi:3-deoxy-manno-octulosonate cytidylyltransferase (CMP-KDO synthetase)